MVEAEKPVPKSMGDRDGGTEWCKRLLEIDEISVTGFAGARSSERKGDPGPDMEQTVVDNRYVLSGLLGGGGMGKVYLACDEVLDRDVALKVLREQYAEDEEFVERFEREAKAAASLNYPHIVSVYDRGRTQDGTYYIAMEHVPGGTLKDRILKEGPLDPDEAARIGAQVADALGVAHASGIIHRDVKPQNVLLTAAGDAKVADFGIARAASATSLSNSSLVLGTAKYMSPEQAMGDPTGPESDLYSLGVVLYETLTGQVPFDADSAVGVAMKHVTELPRSPREQNPAVPQTLDAVVMKLLEKRPEDRYPGAAELVADLQRASDGLPPILPATAAPGAGTPEDQETERLDAPGPQGGGTVPGRPPSRRKRALLLLVAAATLVALIGLAGLALSGGAGGPVVGSLGEAAEGAQRALGVGEGDVPEVVGLTEEEARDRLAEEGFGVAVERRESAENDEGRVLEQSVPAGEEARRGSRVALAVGGGPRTVQAPELVGLTPTKAEEELEEAGLKAGDREEVPNREIPEGEVVAQDPPAGEMTEAGTEVDLTVSSGPAEEGGPDRVDVPDVSGLGVDEATALLLEAGCEVAGTRTEPSPEPEGTIVGTDPPVGTAVASGAPVTLIVSGGPGTPSDGGAPSEDPAGQPASPSASASPDPSPSPAESSPSPEPPAESSPAPAPSSPDAASPSPEPPAESSPSPAPSSADSSASPDSRSDAPPSPAPASPAPSSADSSASPSSGRDDGYAAGDPGGESEGSD